MVINARGKSTKRPDAGRDARKKSQSGCMEVSMKIDEYRSRV